MFILIAIYICKFGIKVSTLLRYNNIIDKSYYLKFGKVSRSASRLLQLAYITLEFSFECISFCFLRAAE